MNKFKDSFELVRKIYGDIKKGEIDDYSRMIAKLLIKSYVFTLQLKIKANSLTKNSILLLFEYILKHIDCSLYLNTI